MTPSHPVLITKEAKADLAKLDRAVATRVVQRIRWLTENLDNTTLLPLHGNWQGYYKFRIGDYRVIYRLEPQEPTAQIVVEYVRHRREVYK